MVSNVVSQGDSAASSTYDLASPNRWQSPMQTTGKKVPCDFDAIVVGSGIGGLTCASLLAKHNIKVLVLEKHFQVGGFCSSFKRRGFTFTSGVEDVSGVEDGDLSKLLGALDLKKEDLFVLNRRLFIVGGKRIILDGTKEGTISGLTAAFSEEAAAIRSFIDEVDDILHEKDPQILARWKSVTYQQKLDQFFHDPSLKAFFCSLLGYLGVTADRVQASDVIGACLSYFIVGGHYTKGGPQHLADTLREYITAHGGSVMTSAPVNEVLISGGEVQGVRVGDHTFTSRVVVGNVNAKTLFRELVQAGAVQKAYVDAVSALRMSISLCMVQVGCDLDVSSLPSHIQVLDPDGRVHGVINSNADPTLAPAGMSSITFLSRGDIRQTPQRGTAEYLQYKEELAHRVLARAEKIIPALRDHIVVQDVSTPRTFERYTSMPEGAIYAFDQSERRRLPYFKTPVRGLYLASASSAGGGIESVVGAGVQCAEDIAGHKV